MKLYIYIYLSSLKFDLLQIDIQPYRYSIVYPLKMALFSNKMHGLYINFFIILCVIINSFFVLNCFGQSNNFNNNNNNNRINKSTSLITKTTIIEIDWLPALQIRIMNVENKLESNKLHESKNASNKTCTDYFSICKSNSGWK